MDEHLTWKPHIAYKANKISKSTGVIRRVLQVSNWLQANKLTLNFKKSNYMIFRPYQKLLSYLPIFKVYDPILNKSQILEMKNFVKYLGILIDFDLSWKNHIDLICQKISKTLGILARLRHTIPLSPLLKIYQAPLPLILTTEFVLGALRANPT